ncbi:MAG: glycosyltransferase family 39 protein [Candidatus Omnitrophica bacterium]|nr:glycosyltransferase family 39 protein [Candidatus Omnitrophota bacterium]
MKKNVNIFRNFIVKYDFLLISILILGFFIRIFQLASKSITYDEACSICFIQKPWITIFSHRYLIRPGYFLLLKIWTGFFGYTENAIRSFSVLLGTVSIYLIYKTGKILFDRTTGIFAAFLLSISVYHVIRSQQARPYAFLMLLVLLLIYYFWKIIQRGKVGDYVLYTVIMIFAMYTHFPAAAIIFLLNNFFYIGCGYRARSWLFSQLLILICGLFLIFPASKCLEVENYSDKYCPVEYERILPNILADFSYGRKINHGGVGDYNIIQRPFFTKIPFYLFILLIYGASVQLILSQKKRKIYFKKQAIFLLLWLCFPLVILMASNFFLPISKWIKMIIISLPAFIILISICLKKISGYFRGIFIGLILCSSCVSLHYYYCIPHDSWREVAGFVKKNIEENDVVILAPIQNLANFWYYYSDKRKSLLNLDHGYLGKVRLIDGKWQDHFWDGSNLIIGIVRENVDEIIKKDLNLENQSKTIWLIISPGWMYDRGKLLRYIERKYSLKEKYTFPWEGVEVFYCKPL